MKFQVGQRYASELDPDCTAKVVQVRNGNREAWIELCDSDGAILDNAWVLYRRFIGSWTLL